MHGLLAHPFGCPSRDSPYPKPPFGSAESAQHQVSVVAQLLILLDGIEACGQIFVLATTNRPEHVDAALRRPGRSDQVVWMGLPDGQLALRFNGT